jgi:Tol biopolymer transport system component
VSIVACTCQPASAANRYDPRFRFRSIQTQRFTIHFHQGEETLARRLAAIAEDVAARVAGELGTPNGRVHVILVDQHDVSNGWANPVPYNVIEISAAAPSGESSIGNTDDWLRLVLSHEYTHIVHLDKARGWIGGLRWVFGHSPLLYPNLFLPLSQIEGIATYNESVLTGEGRIPAGDFRNIIERAAADRRFEPIDRTNGGLVDWPGGAAHYAYGAYFDKYLADRFGAESMARLADETSRRVPYFFAPAFKKVFNRSLGELWEDFEADATAQARDEPAASVRLTHHGFGVGSPAFGSAGRLFYSIANPHGFPSLMELRAAGSAPREVTWRYFGNQASAAGGLLVFDQSERVHNVGLQSDLYAVAQDGGRTRRLTHRARAGDPDVAPDGRTIVCTVQAADRRFLATLTLPDAGRMATPAVLLSAPSIDYSMPRWSPDGRSIAVERRRVGGPSEIVVVDVAARTERVLVSSRDDRNVTPFWLTATTLLFASDRNGQPFSIYAIDLQSGMVKRLNGVGYSAQSPVVSPDGRTLVFVGYTTDGYDLFSLPLASASWSEVADVAAPALSQDRPVGPAPVTTPDTPYRPWPAVLPRFWTPVIESDASELSFGAESGGSDPLGRHPYGGRVAWSTSRLRPDWSVSYAYDRWWPTLFASVSDDTDPFREGEIRTREVNAGAVFVVARVRWSQALLASVNASRDEFSCDGCEETLPANVKRGAIRTGWIVDTAKEYGYSISRESGATFRVTGEVAPDALGSDAGNSSATVDTRGYFRLGPRHAAVAVRAAGATAWGDARARRVFSASGNGPAARGFDFGRDAIGLLRGFASDSIVGTHAAVANVDYRLPIVWPQRGVGTVPLFFRTIHAAIFADGGHAWAHGFDASDVRFSTGVELSMDTVVGYWLPLTFTTGVAWRRDPVGNHDGVAMFGRIGRAF